MKNKIILFFSSIYYIFAFLSTLNIINIYLDNNFNFNFTIIYIILFCILFYQKNKLNEQATSMQEQDINNTAILINNINKFDYSNLQIIKNIEFNFLKIKIVLKDGISQMFDYKYFYFLKSEKELIVFDRYLYNNYNKEINKHLPKSDKNYEEFYIKLMKENSLHYLCIDYNIKR